MKDRRVVVATRKSELALAQCRAFVAQLAARFPELELDELQVVTTGDRIVDRPLSEVGGKGLFLKEIEEALLDGSARLAVHSLKDVPPELHPGLAIVCVPEREDPRDVLITAEGVTLDELPQGARLGTSSLRRGIQLLERRPDLRVESIRGNVGTRVRKCLEGVVDATVLARAGLNRLGADVRGWTIPIEQSLPAVGQGALGIEVRSDDQELIDCLRALDHEETRRAVEVERGVMAAVEGDCKTPVAAYAVRDGDRVWVRGMLSVPWQPGHVPTSGAPVVRLEERAPWPNDVEQAHAIGRQLGERLRAALAQS
ncbi:MAG TPA: hydroxymethylbilane synthase [Polyangiaceae bacterium]|nr:hydroxymethylbilane synthase [Polyangiaceae bacterium]